MFFYILIFLRSTSLLNRNKHIWKSFFMILHCSQLLSPCPTAIPALDLFAKKNLIQNMQIYTLLQQSLEPRVSLLLTTIRSAFVFYCRARCVIKICLQLSSFLLCARIEALELYSTWATDLTFVYQLGHVLEKVENPCNSRCRTFGRYVPAYLDNATVSGKTSGT